MKKLNRLWRASESAPGLAAIPAQWQHYCGADYQVVKPFLKPTEMVGAAYPCRDCSASGCARDIVDSGNGGMSSRRATTASSSNSATLDLSPIVSRQPRPRLPRHPARRAAVDHARTPRRRPSAGEPAYQTCGC